jgi:hypothetical protein
MGVLLGIVDFSLAVFSNLGNDLIVALAAALGADGIVEVAFGKEAQLGFSGNAKSVGRFGLSVRSKGFDDSILILTIFVKMSCIFVIGDLF